MMSASTTLGRADVGRASVTAFSSLYAAAALAKYELRSSWSHVKKPSG